MSLNLSVTIPLDAAAAIRHMQYTFECIETNDPSVEAALATVCLAVVDAIKALPYSFSSSDFSPPELEADARVVSGESSDIFPSPSLSSEISEPFGLGLFSDVGSLSSLSSIEEATVACRKQNVESWGSMSNTGLQDDFSIDIDDGRGSVFPAMVFGDMTIVDLQARIQELCGLQADQQRLVWRGYRLNQPEATLSSYGIRPNDQIALLRHLLPSAPIAPCTQGVHFEDPQFECFLQTLSGKIIPIHARADVTTAELAAGIAEKVGVAEKLQRLVHRGSVIYDGFLRSRGWDAPIWRLDELRIGHESVVKLHIVNSLRQ